jgi:membrane-bound ClpP family serine protease
MAPKSSIGPWGPVEVQRVRGSYWKLMRSNEAAFRSLETMLGKSGEPRRWRSKEAAETAADQANNAQRAAAHKGE